MILRIYLLIASLISLVNSQLKDGYCQLKCPIPINVDIKCGSNGVSYQNEPELLCAKSLCYPDLYTAYNGYCNKDKASPPAKHEQETNKLDDFSTTTRVIHPSNTKKSNLGRSRTINGPNYFENLHFQNDSNLNLKPSTLVYTSSSNQNPTTTTLKKRRPSGLAITSNDLRPDTRYTYSKCLDNCICSLSLLPVCGSNRITYGNKCILECAQRCEPSLQYHHDGFCGKIFFSTPDVSRIKFFRAFSSETGILA